MIDLDSKSIKKYLKAGKIARKALDKGKELCEEGTTYFKVVKEVEKVISKHGAKPAFPINISVNEVGAHYAPYPGDGKIFKKGDIVKIDIGCHIDGHIADNAATVEIGTKRQEKLIKAPEEALSIALKTVRPGVKVKDIGRNIKSVIENAGYKPISNLTGHAIEPYTLHSGTSIPNVARGSGVIEKGMVLAIEPFATNGKGKVKNGERSEIFKLENQRNLKGKDLEFYKWIEERFHHLPFTPRWCKEYGEDYRKRLSRLVRFRSAMVYPVLIEMKNGLITQREHTCIVTSSGCKIITK